MVVADTYTHVASNAEAEYQMQKAQIIKEMYSDTVLPVPLNILEREYTSNHSWTNQPS